MKNQGIFSIQTHIARDESRGDLGRVCDTFLFAAGRMSAPGRVEYWEGQITLLDEMLRRFPADLAASDQHHADQIEAVKLEILDIKQRHSEIYGRAHAEHSASGRQGGFKPRGKDASDLTLLQQSLTERESFLESLAQQANLDRQSLEGTIRQREMNMETARVELAKAQAIMNEK